MLKHFSLPFLASIAVIILTSIVLSFRNHQPTAPLRSPQGEGGQPGCYYQEVQCIRAPCDPILVCPTPPSGVTGTLSVPTPTCRPRPKCLDEPPYCAIDPSEFCPTKSTTYTCPPSGWVDCMTGPDLPKRPFCDARFIDWAKANCPDFEGVAY